MRRQIVFLSLIFAVSATGFAGTPKQTEQGVSLTVYNDNFGVVREARKMAFEQGVNTVKFTEVASAIDPTSVGFSCLSSPGAVTILEQNYEYDLVNEECCCGDTLIRMLR